jgi:hypothetical protein
VDARTGQHRKNRETINRSTGEGALGNGVHDPKQVDKPEYRLPADPPVTRSQAILRSLYTLKRLITCGGCLDHPQNHGSIFHRPARGGKVNRHATSPA